MEVKGKERERENQMERAYPPEMKVLKLISAL